MKLTPNDQLADQIANSDSERHPNQSGPEAAVMIKEEGDTVSRQIAQLSKNQQEVLKLKFHGQLSYEEIARVTGLTATNVGFLLHTAIRKLRQRVVSPAD